MSTTAQLKTYPLRRVIDAWWPLAASWLLMGAELPALSAVVARLADPEIHLAAYGGIVFPLALIIEAPVIMLLAASTALSKDWASYQKLNRFMMVTGGALTVLHILVAFTPLFDPLVRGLLGAKEEIVEPARIGLRIMTPWTYAIAFRRFHQGVLIRFGHSKAVSSGTVIRLLADLLVLAIGYLIGSLPGIVVATSAVAAGVVCEAIYVGLVVQPVLHKQVRPAPPVKEPITLASFLRFYIPLVMTSLLTLLVQPLGSAALNRMPLAIESLATWTVISGFVFMLRSLGIALNEVVVALLEEPKSTPTLLRFTRRLSWATSLALALIAATPLAQLWFGQVSGLNNELTALATQAIWLALPLPGLNTLQSWYQGAILFSRKTRGITEAVFVFLGVSTVILVLGVAWGQTTGLFVWMTAFVLAMAAQTAWLWLRSRPVLLAVQQRDGEMSQSPGKPANA